jgi:hypothetical protein
MSNHESRCSPCEAKKELRKTYPFVGYFSPRRAKNNLQKEVKYHAAAGENAFCVRSIME